MNKYSKENQKIKNKQLKTTNKAVHKTWKEKQYSKYKRRELWK